MKIKLYADKSLEKNAEVYFEKAKKLKKKLAGARKAFEESRRKLDELISKKDSEEKRFEEDKIKKEKYAAKTKRWYEKFHWFISSEGFLCVGGRDATSNEILVKKHTEKEDIVFHTDLAGSPFFIIKNPEKKEIGKNTIEETAAATASYSRAWKQGVSVVDIYYINSEQVSKTAQSGEYMGKGAFMIYGKRNYLRPKLEVAIGITRDDELMSGPVEAIKKNCTKYVTVVQGKSKKGEISKKIKAKIGGELDDIIAGLPNGGIDIKKT